MEREVRHPLLFALCGFVLCIMFAGNLAQAREPQQIVPDGTTPHLVVEEGEGICRRPLAPPSPSSG